MNLSHSKISTYENCGLQFKYRYINNYRPKKESANFVFGRTMHEALELFFKDGIHPAKTFTELWNKQKEVDLDYSKRDSWEKMMESGMRLSDLFIEEEKDRFLETYMVEDFLRFQVDPATTYYGRGDWIGRVNLPEHGPCSAIVDFKTSSSKYDDIEAHLSDQLTAYYKAAHKYPFEIEKVAMMVLIKTKTPKIQWVVGERTQEDTEEYLEKVKHYNEQINRGIFLQQIGMSCKWCDYQAMCIGNQEEVKNGLYIQVYDDTINVDHLEFDQLHYVGSCPYDQQPMEWLQRIIKQNNIEGYFYFKVSKQPQNYYYKLDGNELKRLYNRDLKNLEVA